MTYTLDTNAIIYFLKEDPKTNLFLGDLIAESETPTYVSTITEIELFGFPKLSIEERQRITALLATLSSIPVDSSLARMAGSLRRLYKLKTPDSAIAATALFTGSTLVTRNVRDFKKIPSLNIKEI